MLFSCRLSLNLAKNIEEKEEIVIKEGKQSELSLTSFIPKKYERINGLSLFRFLSFFLFFFLTFFLTFLHFC